jgi:hypothetical protein
MGFCSLGWDCAIDNEDSKTTNAMKADLTLPPSLSTLRER